MVKFVKVTDKTNENETSKPDVKVPAKGKDVKKEVVKPAPEKKRARSIVRLMSVDLDSNLSIYNALRNIKGIGFRVSSAILHNAGIDPSHKLGTLTPEQLAVVEKAALDGSFPVWMRNTTDKHILKSDIDLTVRNDVNLMQKTRSYKGIRHERGLPVRGQRTRSSFRKNKTIGVVKKKAMAAKTGKPAK